MLHPLRPLALRDVIIIALVLVIAFCGLGLLLSLFAPQRNGGQTQCVSNMKQLGQGTHLYTEDHDGYYPLAMTANSRTRAWRVGLLRDGSDLGEFPHNWRPSQDEVRWYENLTHWTNAVYPYVQNYGIYACPVSSERDRVDRGVPSSEYASPNVNPRNVSYTYNGFLHMFPNSGIVEPAQLPVLWEGHGKTQIIGFGLHNPALRCTTLDEPCIYRRGGPPCGLMFGSAERYSNPGGSYWVENKGQNWTMADTHVKWRRLGVHIANKGTGLTSPGPPYTDWRVDPFTGYNDEGFAAWYWSDGCHSLLFRPDYDFSD
ncbi:MAG: hypothetical protein IH851_05620 [Armatimonadetes bacterium]|nr:hypothetical protein [Armatimonadota bacterium]